MMQQIITCVMLVVMDRRKSL